MKLSACTNDSAVIEARNEAEYPLVCRVAAAMEASTDYLDCVVTSTEAGQWVHICAVWDDFQAELFREAYKDAKAHAMAEEMRS